MKQRNADLHCHPSQKSILTKNTNPFDNVEYNTKVKFPLLPIFKCSDEKIGDILDSQSSLSQLKNGNFSMVFWSIIAFERDFLVLPVIQEAMDNETKAEIDKEFLEKMKKADVSYFEALKTEWQVLKDYINSNGAGHEIQLIDKISGYNSNFLNVFPSVESTHSFYVGTNSNGINPEHPDPGLPARIGDFVKNEPVSYITLTHLTNKGVFTHCHSSKLISQEEILKSGWSPRHIHDRGYSDMGEEIIDLLIHHNVGVDIKHLCYVGRRSLYSKLEKLNGSFRLLASHCGVAGMSIDRFYKKNLIEVEEQLLFKVDSNDGKHQHLVKLNFRRPAGILKGNAGIRFNPQSINLYDEDIEAIIRLGGLIGVSLDQRILGQNSAKDEFVTLTDFESICTEIGMDPEDYLGAYKLRDGELLTGDQGFEVEQNVGDENKKKPRKTKRVAQTILHILNVGSRIPNRKAWEHICLGSDYDGILDPINSCLNSAQVPSFKDDLQEILEDKVDNFYIQFGISAEDLIWHIFEENAIRFYQRTARSIA